MLTTADAYAYLQQPRDNAIVRRGGIGIGNAGGGRHARTLWIMVT